MNKTTTAILLIAVGVVALVAFLYLTTGGFNLQSVLDSGDSDPDPNKILFETEKGNVTVVTDLYFPDMTIHQALCALYNKTIPFTAHQPYMHSLHMKSWGVNGQTGVEIRDAYRTKYRSLGYAIIYNNIYRGAGWVAYQEMYGRGNDVAGLIVGDGPAIEMGYNVDAVVLTAYGTQLDWANYILFVSRY